MNSTKNLLSIVIPVFNEEGTIKEVLENLSKLKIPKVDIEIVVVGFASEL